MEIAYAWRLARQRGRGYMPLGTADRSVQREDWQYSAGAFLGCTELFLQVLKSCLAAESAHG